MGLPGQASVPSLPEVIAIDALLAPISADNPTGEDPFGGAFERSGITDQIKQARKEEDDLPRGVWERERKVADWPRVISLTTKALAERTKDLTICAFLAEALACQHPLVGVRDALKLVRGMLERYWENVYPKLDDDGPEARVQSLEAMDGYLEIPIKLTPVIKSAAGVTYSFIHWEHVSRSTVQKEREELEKAKKATRLDYYEQVLATANECWAEYQALEGVIDEKFEDHAVGLGKIKYSIDGVRGAVGSILKEMRPPDAGPVTPPPVGGGEIAPERPEPGGEIESRRANPVIPSGPVGSREEALKRLGEVADFFRKTEPHSPVSYLIDRAVKWSDMPLEQWLQDVITDNGVLDKLRDTLGIKKK